MRLVKALIALLFVAFGVLFGALNRQPVTIDLGLVDFTIGLGVALLLALLAGALLAGMLLSVAVVWPQHRRLGRGAAPAEPDRPGDHE